jgi:hypothetical protein
MEKQIGEAAGRVWQTLSKGPVAPAQLPKVAGLSADVVNQAIGWLAREGKVAAVNTPKGTVLKLKG